jgi:hypothetical protein
MKKSIFLLISFLYLTFSSFAQAKKPIVMIVPSDNWCFQNGFIEEVDNQGIKEKRPNYARALMENSDLGNVITKINGLMGDRGFPLETLDEALKTVKQNAAEMMLMQSKTSGAEVIQSAYDQLMNVVKSDIIIKLGWTLTKSGFNKSIQINIEAVDAYTGESIASQNPPGEPSSTADIPTMLSIAVLSVIDNFNSRLQTYFDDLHANGRKITVRLNKFSSSWDGDFESEFEYNGSTDELNTIIDDWFSKNTVKGRFNNTGSTENVMNFKQVRIPMYNEKGKAIDAKDFVKPLQKMLQGAPFNIPTKLVSKGMGQAWLILGEK